MKKRIVDKRKKEKYLTDDDYLNGMARLCGWQGTIVYNSLCRHSNISQECFPSIKLMAEQHGVSRPTIIKGIEALEKRKVIKVEKTRSKKGTWLNNLYLLLDKTEWVYDQVNDVDTAIQVNENTHPSKPQLHIQVNDVDTKETQREGNTYKETHLAKQGSAVVKVIDSFEEVNPSFQRWYGNKTQREAIERMLKIYGEEQILKIVAFLPKSNTMRYLPTITTPLQLETKMAQLKAGVEKLKGTKPMLIKI